MKMMTLATWVDRLDQLGPFADRRILVRHLENCPDPWGADAEFLRRWLRFGPVT